MDKRYSVLMSVYKKERPEYLHAALKSMTGQSWRPSEIVLVCDGPLTTELEAVLEDIEFQGLLKTVRLEQPWRKDCRSVAANGWHVWTAMISLHRTAVKSSFAIWRHIRKRMS